MLNTKIDQPFEDMQDFANYLLSRHSEQELTEQVCVIVPSPLAATQLKDKMHLPIISYQTLPDNLLHFQYLAPQMPKSLPLELDAYNYELILEDMLYQMRKAFPYHKFLHEPQIKGDIANFFHNYYTHNMETPALEGNQFEFVKKLITLFEDNCQSIHRLHTMARRNHAIVLLQKHIIANPQRKKHYYLFPTMQSSAYIKTFSQLMTDHGQLLEFQDQERSAKYQIIHAENIIDEGMQVALSVVEQLNNGNTKIGIICEDPILKQAVTTQLTAYDIAHTRVLNLNQLPGIGMFVNLIEMINQPFCNQWQWLALLKYTNIDSKEFELKHLRNSHEINSLTDLIKTAKQHDDFISITSFAEELLSFQQYMQKSLNFAERLNYHLQFCSKHFPAMMNPTLENICTELLAGFKILHTIDLKTYYSLLQNISKQRISEPIENSCINFLSLADIPYLKFDALYIMHANEGSLPNINRPWLAITPDIQQLLSFPSTAEQCASIGAHFNYALIAATTITISRAKVNKGMIAKISRFLPNIISNQPIEVKTFSPKKHHNENRRDDQLAMVKKADRPHIFSASAIEYLINNPYIYYVRYILKLMPLKKIGATMTELFGIAIHDAIKRYGKKAKLIDKMEFVKQFVDFVIKSAPNDAMMLRLWQYRTSRIAAWLYDYEQKLGDCPHLQEHKLATIIDCDDTEATIYAIFDRILIAEKDITIIDYKTGYAPTQTEVNKGLSPQLAVENFIVSNLYDQHEVSQCYIALKGRKEIARIINIFCDYELTYNSMQQLLMRFICNEEEYFINQSSDKYADYKHILRQ